ncbi:MAG: Pyruvate flavodoxin/ferredoxin oxidoreductase domain protein [Candidatus Roizmanbacteria bacterium GW2011_GWA2_35_19]|uniref:Pyruvate flavodoxin/ferredoxin oxidoreductase domain protein n=2 Tax=Candidatus Roizmaniibacteriota TaxID=1752723 RepID=A0A0G0CEF5_9BACT|nr:MAG: Pyruvate flavodoxin/ferredoxin oxidoreductase domain protein [Candidatus Roizmanbacteria bacterium GW2011_GWC2_35_12]KKP74461.1 MAG: Pyruvate flavodoxin/ferredoxin oxidoreductase domain protein [Candidatus Roizmanbacteria bacterium GW2011_GWA2_35_19]
MDITWKIGGEAGFGIMTTGLAFSKIVSRLGYQIFDYVEYPSLIRGGHNAYEVHVSHENVSHLKPEVDVLVCLNKETYTKHQSSLTKKSYVIYDEQEFTVDGDFVKINVPFKKILADLKGQMIMKNTIALGASLSVLGAEIDELIKILEDQFSKKGEAIVNFNKNFANAGYDHIKNNYSKKVLKFLTKRESSPSLVMTGNDAFSLGSVIADSRFYCAYPMTPSSTILTTMASWAEKVGLVVRHAEDEIAAINTAIGASFTGVRASVGTSGGGFALMVESLSFAGVTEIPIVVFIAQRPGPATGMPTWTEQGDLLFAVHAGHGEFQKIVLSASDIEEMIEVTAEAYNLAEVYQMPVIVMSDMYLSEGHKSITKKFIDDFITNYKVNHGKLLKEITNGKSQITNEDQNSNNKTKNYLRYKITEDGVSPRLIPGTPGHYYQANSYEHLEDGHTTEEAQPRLNQVNKRARKWDTYLKIDFKPPKVYGDLDKAEVVFVSWGSNKGAVIEAQKQLKDKTNTAFINFTHLYPLNKKIILPFFKENKKYILVENNSWGQFGKLLLQETGIEIKEKILRYDGRTITPEYIIKNFKF